MNDMSFFQAMPISLWIIATASGFVIIILGLFLHLFYRKRLEVMEPLNDDVGGLINLKQQLEGDVDSLKDWIANQEEELLRLKAEREEQEIIRAEIQRLEQEASQKEDDNKTLRDEVGNLENQRHMLVQTMDKLEKEKSEIQKEIKTLGKEEKESQKVLKEIDKELEKFRKEEEKLKVAIKKANEEISRLENEHKKLEKEINGAKESLKDFDKKVETRKEDLKGMEESLKKKETEIASLKNTKTDLVARVQTLSDKLKSVGQMPKEAFDSLNQPAFDKVSYSRDIVSESEALEQLFNLTEESGFDLPKRLQKAFHTSLKTSDISCLTVMAGVSGTGKSAFPKLYAQSMGIHFLPLAVEPRWDSPQDLFGFLNYMENRFESTRLGRSLVQFNNSPHADKNANLNDKILLVLLDEMNLARIEYYFSEFLSKLEMRRNVNIENQADYRMVSTELYAGNRGNEELDLKPSEPIFLYAGSNVLFVGTMNEDETTQSLSDKVIDRANVIYFGKPDRLKTQTQQISNETFVPINAKDWKNWIVKPNEDTITDFDRIDDLLNDINSTLSDLGRPFGWRTYKAMMSYIANHPNVNIDGNSGMSPLSDQVAMRVMPKLKGLDMGEYADVFNRLGSQLSVIDDNRLNEAFKKAQNSTMGFFDWRGINWSDKDKE